MDSHDYVFGPLVRIADAVVRTATGKPVERTTLEAELRSETGLDLAALDALPAEILLSLLDPSDPHSVARAARIAEALEVLSEDDSARSEPRRLKVRALRERLQELQRSTGRV